MLLHPEWIIFCVADRYDDVEGGVTLIVGNIWDWRLEVGHAPCQEEIFPCQGILSSVPRWRR